MTKPELERLDLHHEIMINVTGKKLYLAPIPDDVKRILDIGTGTGIWAIEMGDTFPNAEILGNDLSATQPGWVPPNVKFEIDDVESPWSHATGFDFVFCRYMVGAIQDWPKLMTNVYNNLAPKGWAEFQDYDLTIFSEDGTVTEDLHTVKWNRLIMQAISLMKRDPRPGLSLEKWLKDAGFQNVTHQKFTCPSGLWPKDPALKELGRYHMAQLLDGLEAFSLRLMCGVHNWKEEEVMVLLANVRQELKSGRLHICLNIHVAYGQKVE